MGELGATAAVHPQTIPDTWRVAAFMIERYGEFADVEAAELADEFHNRGDLDGQRVWLNVLNAIDRLQRVQPGETAQ